MKTRIHLLLICFIALAVASCKKKAAVPATANNLSLTPDEQQMASADNTFNFKLFNTVAANNATTSNLMLSPLSVRFAIGMTSNGAHGTTLDAIDNAMSFTGFTQTGLNTYYNKLLTELPYLDVNSTLKIGNSIWYDKNFTFLPQFLQINTQFYNAQVHGLDFTSSASVNTINSWVNNATSGKIPTIVDQITPGTVMYLINAIYFKSTWKEKFDPTQTQPLPFHLADNTTVQANFMTGKVDYNGYNDNNVNVFEFPYSNSIYSMVIVMPVDGSTANSLAANITAKQWQSWMTQLKPVTQLIKLPKFNFSYSTSLKPALTTLGMGTAFSNGADFSNMTPNGVKISDVLHKTYIAVDEDGTEAAAVTSVGITITAALQTPVVDHPFIFAIREMSSGLIVFTGVVNNPTAN